MLKIKNITNLTILRKCAFSQIKTIAFSSQSMLTMLIIILTVGDYFLITSCMNPNSYFGHLNNSFQLHVFTILFNFFFMLPVLLMFFKIFWDAYKINSFFFKQEIIL